jgi:hypothetical protein
MEVISVLERVLCSKPSLVLPRRLQAFSVLAVKKWAWASTTSIPTFDNISEIHPVISLEIGYLTPQGKSAISTLFQQGARFNSLSLNQLNFSQFSTLSR